jgi:hypothetical protein
MYQMTKVFLSSLFLSFAFVACTVSTDSKGINGAADVQNNDSRATRSKVDVSDVTAQEEGSYRVIRTLTYDFDYYDSNGLHSISKDLRIYSGSGLMTTKIEKSSSCAAGADYGVYLDFYEVVDGKVDTNPISDNPVHDAIRLQGGKEYSLAVNALSQGNCQGLKMKITLRIEL